MTTRQNNIAAALLCGGTSRRLGFPKEMLRVDGEPLAVKLTRRLQEAFGEVLVLTNNPLFLQHRLHVPLVKDEFSRMGPLAGIHAGLKACSAEACFFLAVDMPLVHNGLIRRLCERYRHSDAPVMAVEENGRIQPLCGVYSRELLPRLEEVLGGDGDLSVFDFLDHVEVERVALEPGEAGCLRDVDSPGDLSILRRAFDDVEPLPLQRMELEGGERDSDVVMEEWPVAVYVNGIKLVTVLCLPTALRELAVGLGVYLGLVRRAEQVEEIRVDYDQRRVHLTLDATDRDVQNATQVLITSTCGASTYGGEMPSLGERDTAGAFRIRGRHLVECLSSLRGRAPTFTTTGGTHQAAFTDGERIVSFFEDIGRHNALDKIVGEAVLADRDLSGGAILATGRVSSEMVVKAVRRQVPVLASRAAVTTNAVRLARKHGLTLVGFARGKRLNVYTRGDRITQ